MAWMGLVGVVLAIKCVVLTNAARQTFNIEPNLQQNLPNDGSLDSQSPYEKLSELQDKGKMNKLGQRLMEILLHPNKGVPLVYVEDYPLLEDSNEEKEYLNQLPDVAVENNINEFPSKRSRYYRKYPWKRQNSREVYDAENRYLCQPSREDVFRLLVALHEARSGTSARTVNFCNRKRPAASVFTNIRFLGKRK